MIVGSTPHPDEAFVRQVVRQLTIADEGVLDEHRVLICDRDRKWSLAVRGLVETSGVRVIQTPFRAPNCNAHAERFVRSVKEECLDRLIPLGERHFRRAFADFPMRPSALNACHAPCPRHHFRALLRPAARRDRGGAHLRAARRSPSRGASRWT